MRSIFASLKTPISVLTLAWASYSTSMKSIAQRANPVYTILGNINPSCFFFRPKDQRHDWTLNSCSVSPCRRILLPEPVQRTVPSAAVNFPLVHNHRCASCLRSMCVPCILQSDRSRAPRSDARISSRRRPDLSQFHPNSAAHSTRLEGLMPLDV